MPDAKEILAAAIEFERFGVGYYSKFRELVSDDKAKPLMKSLSDDEKEHALVLEKALAELGGKPKPPSKELLQNGLREIFPERIRKNSIATKDAISAIKLGIQTEERSIQFYSKNGASASPKLKELFAKHEAMEHGHKQLLEDNLRYLENDGSWFGYVPILD